MANLVVILGDQLSKNISSLEGVSKSDDTILMCEVAEEAVYVKHHKKKIAFLFSAMRHFASGLEDDGYNVRYTKLDYKNNAGSFKGEVGRAVKDLSADKVIVTHPGEYRVLEDIKTWQDDFDVSVDIRDDTRFIASLDAFNEWAEGRKELRMEYFYREMRKKNGILMDGDKPVGGKWNYDSENRKPPKQGLEVPPTYTAEDDPVTKEVKKLVADRFPDHFGDMEPFYFAVTRKQALYALDKFIKERLPDFGDYQDAMVEGEPWMYHAHLSFYLNCGLLEPMEVIKKAEDAYKNKQVPLNAAEGFIRQILGWREYIRGFYWHFMPDLAHKNALQAQRKLPDFYWTGKTDMNCLKQCVLETKKHAYAHHIQRLMVLGNFALLAGINPKEVNEWFLVVYADAYEWVELPNVTSMILYADGGLLASKPYAASGAYINRMSDYCKNCKYNVKAKTGDNACPFNTLYWDFLARNKKHLKGNHRMGMMYKNLERMAGKENGEELDNLRQKAHTFLNKLD